MKAWLPLPAWFPSQFIGNIACDAQYHAFPLRANIKCASVTHSFDQGPVVQSPISTNPELTLNKSYRVNPGVALIGL